MSSSMEKGKYDTEPSFFCSSMISLEKNNLTCVLEDGTENCEYATLCGSPTCINGTLEDDRVVFQDLQIIQQYNLWVYCKGQPIHKQINLVKIVKIPTPEVHSATYDSDEALISIKYKHDYVEKPAFEVEIWGQSVTDKMTIPVTYQPVTIGGDRLRKSDIYHVRVRAKPVEYFDGSWTEWSQVKSFSTGLVADDRQVTVIILCTSFGLLICIVLAVLRWKKEIQAYISPNIPNPKATLAQIHREKEYPPVSFSPEIFNDVSINRIDYAEEKQLTSEFDEGHEDTTGSCQSEAVGSKCSQSELLGETQDGEDSRLEEEMSHLKIKLLDQPEEGQNEGDSRNTVTLQRDCKDETYVTMSSLYKTQ
ncbi:hypothetical protein NFI96_018409 [Prochilodus magdalenae]|nr:hypothetical protein NFI96_018409 [Prochilodus magdalenae]